MKIVPFGPNLERKNHWKKEGFNEAIEQVKEFILKNQKVYKDLRKHAVAHAMKILIHDITQEFQCEWTESE